jgi:hypothetical protein
MISGGGPIYSEELQNLPKRCIFPQLQVFSGFPYIIIVGKKLIPVLFLLLLDSIVVLFCRALGHCFQVRCFSPRPLLGAGVISPICVYLTELC